MHPTTFPGTRFAAGLVALAGLLTATAAAQQPPAVPPPNFTPDVKIDQKTGALLVPLGGVSRFEPNKNAIRDVINRNEDIVDARVDPRTPTTLVLVGRRAGASRLTITTTSAKGEEQRLVYDVIVQPDYELLKTVIRRAVPTANIDVIPGVGSAVILTGYVTKPEDADTIIRIASDATGGALQNLINAIQIGGSQHVQIDLTFCQVDRTELRERGVNFGVSGSTTGFASVLGSLGSTSNVVSNLFPVAGGAYRLNPAITTGPAANLAFGIVPGNIIVALRALRSEGLAKFLSEPKVVTQSGRPAFFLAGGQQAVLGPSSGINGPGVQLQAVGTQLEVLPIVFGNGKIYMEVNPTITAVNNGRGISTSFGFTPGFNQQTTRSSVMMEPGQTFAIGGLLETQVQASSQKVPFLGDLPLLSYAYSNISYQEVETETLIMVTPRFAEAMDCAQAPRRVPTKETRSPDDYELFLETLLEAPRGQRKVWNGHCYNAAHKCDPTATMFPCAGNVCNGVGGAGGCANGQCQPGLTSVPAPAPLPATVPPATMPAAMPATTTMP